MSAYNSDCIAACVDGTDCSRGIQDHYTVRSLHLVQSLTHLHVDFFGCQKLPFEKDIPRARAAEQSCIVLQAWG